MVNVRAHMRNGTPVKAHTRRGQSAAGGGLVIAAVVGWFCLNPQSFPDLTSPLRANDSPRSSTSTQCQVRAVVDGDTFRCVGEGEQRVRILGIDAPETGSHGGRRQCHSRTATAQLANLVDGQRVSLTGDSRQPARDSYGRRLAHVATPSVKDVGQALVRGGHAKTTTFRTDHSDSLRDAQTAAQRAQAGLWGYC